jgi:RNA polymerase sigma-70 factor (ECF subfamily)
MAGESRQKLFLFRKKDREEIPDDQELVRICLTENSEAFEWIVARYRDQVFWTAYRLVLDHEDARDVAQQTFLKVWSSLKSYDPEKSFGAWITKIAANCAIDSLRTRKLSEPLPEIPSAAAESLESSQDIRKIFLRIGPLLPERQRIVLVLREIEGMEICDIARTIQCKESTVRNLLSQAKESFRKKVKELFPEYGM